MWSTPGSSTRRAPGMCAAISRPPSTLTVLSPVRWITRVGTRNCRQNTADVDLAVHTHERGYRGGASAQPLVASPPALEGRVICARRRKSLHASASTPGLFDIAGERREGFFGREPYEKREKLS